MKFSKEKPPIMDRLEKAFGVKWGGSLVVAYGDTIHHTEPLTADLIVHESVHLSRQKDPVQWWESYIRDARFRFGEELLAYREQYKCLEETTDDRNALAVRLHRIAKDFAGIYKLPISQTEAMRLIKMK